MNSKKDNKKGIYNEKLEKYIQKEQAAVSLINYTGKLLYEKGVELVLFRRHLIDTTITKILRLHHYAKNFVKKPINVFETTEIVKNLYAMDLCPSKIDIGKLTFEWIEEKKSYENQLDFLNKKLKFIVKPSNSNLKPKDVILFGFGRIGRLCARELIKQAGKGQQLRIRAVVVRNIDNKSLKKRASLLLQDSVHGRFSGSLEIDEKRKSIIVNGQHIYFLSSSEKVDYNQKKVFDKITSKSNKFRLTPNPGTSRTSIDGTMRALHQSNYPMTMGNTPFSDLKGGKYTTANIPKGKIPNPPFKMPKIETSYVKPLKSKGFTKGVTKSLFKMGTKGKLAALAIGATAAGIAALRGRKK